MTASKTYEQFVSDLNGSQYAVLAVAGHLQKKGYEVTLPPHRVTPSENERFSYQDDCDIKVARAFQVKQSSRDFRSVEEFGFTILTVDEEYKIEKQRSIPPLGYWIVNKSRSGAIFIPWNTNKQWDRFERSDPAQGGRVCVFCRCPASLCRYVAFDGIAS